MSELQIFIAALLVSVALLSSIATRLRIPFPIVLVPRRPPAGPGPGDPERRTEPGPDRRLPAAAALLGRILRRPAGAPTQPTGDRAATGDGRQRRRLRPRGGRPALGLGLHARRDPRPDRRDRDPPPARRPAPARGDASVNDATALVAYKVAVAAAVGEGFAGLPAGLEFLYVAAGGIAIGLVVGYLLAEIRKRLEDPMTESTMSLFSGYAAFLPRRPARPLRSPRHRGLRPLPRLPRARSAGPQTQTVSEVLTFLQRDPHRSDRPAPPQIVDSLDHTSVSNL